MTDRSSEQQAVDGHVAVEPRHDSVALVGRHLPVEPQVGDARQVPLQQVALHDVQHLLQLAEDERAVLGDHHFRLGVGRRADAAVEQELPETRRDW